MRILNAIAEYIEAKAELIREEAATVGLRTYSRAFQEGQQDLLANAEVVYTTESNEDD